MKKRDQASHRLWPKLKDWIQTLPPLPPLREMESDTGTRSIVEAANDAFIAMDEFGRIVDWNLQAEKTFGWPKNDVVGKVLSTVVIPVRFREAHQRGLENYLKTGVGPLLNHRIEVQALHRDGHEVPVELTIYPIQQKNGILFGSFLRDITERKFAQQIQSLQLKIAAVFLESDSLQTAFPALIGNICESFDFAWGEAWMQEHDDHLHLATTWSKGNPTEKGFADINEHTVFAKGEGLPGRVWDSHRPLVLPDLAGDSNLPRKREIMAADFSSAVAVPVRVAEGNNLGTLVFYARTPIQLKEQALDLLSDAGLRMGLFIQRRRAEDNLNRLRADLERQVEERTRDLAEAYETAQVANRLKDEFLATLSHELRTPLGVIQGYVDMLLEGDLSEEEIHSSLLTIHRNTRIQTQIITDLLDVSGIITGKMRLELETVHPETVLNSALETVKMAAGAKKITIVTEFEPQAGPVHGDSRRLQQVFWNLLSNAVKFTPEGGKIFVSTRRADHHVKVSIRDTGKGIDPTFLPHIYERFRQEDAGTTRRYGGLGLGLAIVRHIVEAHGGIISAQSEGLGHGSKFTISLPLAENGASPSSPLSIHSSEALDKLRHAQSLKEESVLVVDDEVDTRKMLGLIMEKAGAQVYTAGDFAEALELYKNFHPRLLISDISMPDHDGYELIAAIKRLAAQEHLPLKTIALTAHAALRDRERILAAGFDQHLVKPIHPEELIRQVEQLLQRLGST